MPPSSPSHHLLTTEHALGNGKAREEKKKMPKWQKRSVRGCKSDKTEQTRENPPPHRVQNTSNAKRLLK